MSGGGQTRTRLRRLSQALLLAFLAVSVALVFWSVLRGPAILAREDNPRQVEAELRIQRGRILDVNNQVLAETVGQKDDLRRTYPTASGGPAVGYYSFRHGTAGIEEGFDDVLRGISSDFWSDYWEYGVLHQTQFGRDVRLTLDATWQRAAEALLGDQKGAVVLMGLPELAVLAMASHPGYDPNRLDEEFDDLLADENAPLLNRATQGLYQPGLVLQPFILATAIDRQLLTLRAGVDDADRRVSVDGVSVGCVGQPGEPATWKEVLVFRCPGPMQALANAAGTAVWEEAFRSFGLTVPPQLPIASETADDTTISSLESALIGQDQLTLSPLQVGVALAALANNGQRLPARLVHSVQDEGRNWQTQLTGSLEEEVVSVEAAQTVLSALVKDNGLAEHAVLVLSGPEASMNAWYLGLAPAGAPRYLVVVVIEQAAQLNGAERVGRSLLQGLLKSN